MSRFRKELKYGARIQIDTDLLLSASIQSKLNSNIRVHLALEELVELCDYLQLIRPQLEIARKEFVRQQENKFDERERIEKLQEGNLTLPDEEQSKGSR
jgi:hypothetical protein